MKTRILLLALSTVLLSACTQLKWLKDQSEVLLGKVKLNDSTFISEDPSLQGQRYHYLNCLAKTSRDGEQEHIDEMITQLQSSAVRDVTLYFHGGLSPERDVVEDLGPSIIGEFSKEGREQYPIFLQYRSGVIDLSLDSFNVKEDSERALREAYLESDEFKSLVSDISELLLGGAPENSVESIEAKSQRMSRNAYNALLSAWDIPPVISPAEGTESEDFVLTEAQGEVLLDLLRGNEPERKSRPEGVADGSAINYFAIEDRFKTITVPSTSAQEGVIDKVFNVKEGPWRFARLMARFALKTNHGIAPTISEEILGMLKWLPELGAIHWYKVKKHSEWCFDDNRNGAELITRLSQLKKDGEIDSINLMSHSAGSILISNLIEFAADNDLQPIDHVIMTAPAVNLHTFNELVVEPLAEKPNQVKRLDVIMLDEDSEIDDNILFPGSLLYYVSSLAENPWHYDCMLMIDQHLQPTRSPYNKGWYRYITCHSSSPKVWKFFEENEQFNLIKYPFVESEKEAASHSGTKLIHKPEADSLSYCIFKRLKDPSFVCKGLSNEDVRVKQKK